MKFCLTNNRTALYCGMFDKDKIYWACKASIEAAACGDYTLNEPYAVKITRIPCGNNFRVSRFHEKTGFVDFDTNASAYVYDFELFETESEAWRYFLAQRLAEISNLENELEEKRMGAEKARGFLAANSA